MGGAAEKKFGNFTFFFFVLLQSYCVITSLDEGQSREPSVLTFSFLYGSFQERAVHPHICSDLRLFSRFCWLSGWQKIWGDSVSIQNTSQLHNIHEKPNWPSADWLKNVTFNYCENENNKKWLEITWKKPDPWFKTHTHKKSFIQSRICYNFRVKYELYVHIYKCMYFIYLYKYIYICVYTFICINCIYIFIILI